jgi:DNA-binding MurR/RpiR family transcriptional regulator
MTSPARSIRQRIDFSYDELPPREQRVADFILDHLGDLAVYNATELARLSNVSKATVSRLFRRLGFENSAEVREHARTLRSLGVPLGVSTPTEQSTSPLAAHFAAELANLREVAQSLTGDRLGKATSLISAARTVVVIGFRNGYPLALHLREQLAQSRDNVRLAPLPGQSIGEELAGLGKQDVVVLFGFRRRPAGFTPLVTALHRRGIPIILLADSSASAVSESCTVWLKCPVDSGSPFDSYAAAMSMINVVATGVMNERITESRARVAGISGVYGDLGELEGPW